MTQNNEHGNVPKMPSMKHLPWSQEEARQQKWLEESDVKYMFEDEDVVILEKMDGANACMTSDKVYARSHSGEPHREEWDYLKKQHREELMHLIPEDLAIFGEYLYARHSIKYEDLPSYFLVFGVYSKSTMTWYDWDTTKAVAEKLGLQTVPELWRGKFIHGSKYWKLMPEGKSKYGDTREGYVLRKRKAFEQRHLDRSMAKCVRENHVQTEELHWRKGGETETNNLK